jgi:hypothetical protein
VVGSVEQRKELLVVLSQLFNYDGEAPSLVMVFGSEMDDALACLIVDEVVKVKELISLAKSLEQILAFVWVLDVLRAKHQRC